MRVRERTIQKHTEAGMGQQALFGLPPQRSSRGVVSRNAGQARLSCWEVSGGEQSNPHRVGGGARFI
jgi:hypothetical protein